MDTFSIVPHVVKGQVVRSIKAEGTIYEAAQIMQSHDISAVVVLDDSKNLIGIVTERDMVRHVVAANLKASDLHVGEIMTRDVKTAKPDDSAHTALERMREIKARHLPLVDDDGVVGMVSMRDLRNFIAKHPRKSPGPLKTLLSRFL